MERHKAWKRNEKGVRGMKDEKKMFEFTIRGTLRPKEKLKITEVEEIISEFLDPILDDEEYNFKIEIPADILSRQTLMPQVGGILGQWIELAQALSRMGGRTRFFLEAKLNIPGGLDINRRKRITIR